MIVPQSEWEKIASHAKETYPLECIGLLLGRFDGGGEVSLVRPAHNLKTELDRYELDPLDFIMAEEEAEKKGLEIIGFYHSHPDDRPHPSAYDRERAWEEYFYLIISVWKGIPGEAKVWVFDPVKKDFREKDLIIERR